MNFVDQRDLAEGATFAIARTYMNKGKFIPSAKEAAVDIGTIVLSNVAGPQLDRLEFVQNLPSQANRALKLLMADMVVNVLSGKPMMQSLSIKNLAAVGAGVYVGDYANNMMPDTMGKAKKQAAANKDARSVVSSVNPLTAGGV